MKYTGAVLVAVALLVASASGAGYAAPECPFPSNEITFYPVAGNCSLYWECFQGIRYLMSCPSGLYWNVEHNICDYPGNVDCSRNTSTTTSGPPTTTSDSPVWTPDPQCPYPSEEITFFPHPTNCSQYYECYVGNKYLMSCPDGLYWNDVENACDYRANVNCDRDTPTTTPKPTTAPGNTTTSTTESPVWTPDPQCPYPSEEITFFPHPTNCSQFYECYLGSKYLLSCPEGLYWNDVENACDYRENVNCDRTPATPSTPSPQTTQTTPSPNTICAGKPDGTYLSDPDDCSRFYECVGGKALEGQCPDGLVWNEPAHTCDYPQNVSCNN